jgi:starvation-inducible DNA-binding protein
MYIDLYILSRILLRGKRHKQSRPSKAASLWGFMHMSGPHFRDYHLLLDDHGDQLFAMTDEVAERVRKIGGTTIRSIGHIARLQRIQDNDAEFVTAPDMLSELREDDKALLLSMRAAHVLCDDAGDVATASLLENWIDQSQRRIWFLFESTRG